MNHGEGSTADDAVGRGRRGIQSVEVGGQLLRALALHGTSMALKDLAREAGMSAAKAHPYLVSFGRIGLVRQDEDSGRYALGPLALQLGLISLQQATPLQVATPLLAPLARQLGQTAALAVWESQGPTIVRIEEPPTIVYASMRHGTVFSLAGTATGRVFGAYLDASVARAALQAEQRRRRDHGEQDAGPGMPGHDPVPAWPRFRQQLDDVRRRGLSRSEGETVRGINALSAPVFDAAGAIVLAVTAIGPMGTFDASWDGPVARGLKAWSDDVSRRLGANGAQHPLRRL
ncbi:MAG: IclR family transcriptional regulator [Burkholderiaceae bacterium]